MPRLRYFSALFVFLVAIATNCVQASQVTLDPIQSPVTAIDPSNFSDKADASEFLISNDDSDDDLRFPALHSLAVSSSFGPHAACFDFQLSYLLRLPFPRQTILQI